MLTSRPTHGGGAPFGIDLDAGVAKITVRRTGTSPDTGPDPAATDQGGADGSERASTRPAETSHSEHRDDDRG